MNRHAARTYLVGLLCVMGVGAAPALLAVAQPTPQTERSWHQDAPLPDHILPTTELA